MNRKTILGITLLLFTTLACLVTGQGEATIPSPTPTALPTATIAVTAIPDSQVCVEALNVRAQPNARAVILETLFLGRQVQVRAEQVAPNGGRWVQIETGTLTGWVNARYLCQKQQP